MEYFESIQTDNCGLSSELLGIHVPSFCECPDVAPPSYCELCRGGNVKNDQVVENFLSANTCKELADFFLTIVNATLCSGLLQTAQDLCCEDGYVPPTCTVCRNGQAPLYPKNNVQLPGEGTFACSELEPLAVNVPGTFCPEFQSTVAKTCCEEPEDDGTGTEVVPGGSGGASMRTAMVVGVVGMSVIASLL
jgi:hypothetical protein